MIEISTKWCVRIVCDNNEKLKNMVGTIDTPYLSIVSNNEDVFIKSNEFDKCEAASEVITIGERLLKTFLGVISVNASLLKLYNIRINGVANISNNQYYLFASDHLDINCSITVVNGINTPKNILNDPNRWINLLAIDNKVSQIFNYARLGIEKPFVMYDIFELIREDVNKDFTKIDKKYTRSKMSSFTGSLNDPRVLGEDSRHAVPVGKDTMTNPLTLDECRGFATELLHEWIHYKLRINNM